MLYSIACNIDLESFSFYHLCKIYLFYISDNLLMVLFVLTRFSKYCLKLRQKSSCEIKCKLHCVTSLWRKADRGLKNDRGLKQ